MKIYNFTRGTLLAHQVIMANTFWSRLRGLLGRPDLPGKWCMLLKPCSSVHTVFMSFSIDVLFVDKHYRVLEVVKSMPPYRFSKIIRGSSMVIELAAGSPAPTGTTAGDIIKIVEG